MKSRTPILFFAIVFTLVCVYQLSFTWKVNSINEEKIEYTETQLEINKNDELSEITAILFFILPSLFLNKRIIPKATPNLSLDTMINFSVDHRIPIRMS